MPRFTLPPLPYAESSLEPHIDTETMNTHHTKHHATYIANLNTGIAKFNHYEKLPLAEIILEINAQKELGTDLQFVKNNAGGHYNHSLFWYCMSPVKNEMSFCLEEKMLKSFGDMNSFFEKFIESALKVFGSGWVWIVYKVKDDILDIVESHDQDTPIMKGIVPILAFDVWEHAYYLKYKNMRKDYIMAFLEVIDWKNVSVFYEKYAKQGKFVHVEDSGSIKLN